MSTLGNIIKEKRKERGITQEELAELSRMNLRTVQRIENGETSPRGNSLNAICEVLEVEMSDIMPAKQDKENKVARVVLEIMFLIALNILIMSLFGFLTFDTDATRNSRLAALLLGFLVPFLIVYYTMNLKPLERVLKFGTGLIIYMVWIMIQHTFPEPRAIMYGLVPSIIIFLAVLYYGKSLFSYSKS